MVVKNRACPGSSSLLRGGRIVCFLAVVRVFSNGSSPGRCIDSLLLRDRGSEAPRVVACAYAGTLQTSTDTKNYCRTHLETAKSHLHTRTQDASSGKGESVYTPSMKGAIGGERIYESERESWRGRGGESQHCRHRTYEAHVASRCNDARQGVDNIENENVSGDASERKSRSESARGQAWAVRTHAHISVCAQVLNPKKRRTLSELKKFAERWVVGKKANSKGGAKQQGGGGALKTVFGWWWNEVQKQRCRRYVKLRLKGMRAASRTERVL